MADTLDPSAPAETGVQFLAAKTLAGDVRDFLLDRLKHDHSALPWHLRGEDEQRRTIDSADAAARALVEKVWHLCTAQERPTLVAKLTKAAKRDRIEATVAVDGLAPLRHALMDAVGKEVLVVLADSDVVMGDRGRPQASPDQRAMFGDDPDDDGPIYDRTPSGRQG